MIENIGLLVEADAGPGILHKLTGVIAAHRVDITSVDIMEPRQILRLTLPVRRPRSSTNCRSFPSFEASPR